MNVSPSTYILSSGIPWYFLQKSQGWHYRGYNVLPTDMIGKCANPHTTGSYVVLPATVYFSKQKRRLWLSRLCVSKNAHQIYC